MTLLRLQPSRPATRETAMLVITVNEVDHELNADPQMPLLWALRDLLKLHGTKYGCGKALCGACTVHLDGRPIRSCVTPLSAVANRKITTIEGLSAHGRHVLQQTWLALDVVQCGYCQSGQLMAAAALLAENPAPTDIDIDSAMSGNICRCGTYPRIRAAIHRAAAMLRNRDAP